MPNSFHIAQLFNKSNTAIVYIFLFTTELVLLIKQQQQQKEINRTFFISFFFINSFIHTYVIIIQISLKILAKNK